MLSTVVLAFNKQYQSLSFVFAAEEGVQRMAKVFNQMGELNGRKTLSPTLAYYEARIEDTRQVHRRDDDETKSVLNFCRLVVVAGASNYTARSRPCRRRKPTAAAGELICFTFHPFLFSLDDIIIECETKFSSKGGRLGWQPFAVNVTEIVVVTFALSVHPNLPSMATSHHQLVIKFKLMKNVIISLLYLIGKPNNLGK